MTAPLRSEIGGAAKPACYTDISAGRALKEKHMEVTWLFKPPHPLWHAVRRRLSTPIPLAAFARSPWRALLAVQSARSNNH